MNEMQQMDRQRVQDINRSGRQPALFIHGLWLEPSSWHQWLSRFENAGYGCAAPGWPRDKADVTALRVNTNDDTETLAEVVDHFERIVRCFDKPPVLVGHSFGGLIAQLLADRDLAAATIAIAPAAFRGVLPLPLSAVRSASPVLRNPANRHHRIALSFDQFRYAFANALPEEEARDLYGRYAVPAPGGPLFEAALANLNPWTDDRLDPHRASRGPLLFIAGERDHTVPPSVVEAEYAIQKSNLAVTEYSLLPDRGHSLVIDHGWEDVAELALNFAARFALQRPQEQSIDEAEEESFPASGPAAL